MHTQKHTHTYTYTGAEGRGEVCGEADRKDRVPGPRSRGAVRKGGVPGQGGGAARRRREGGQ